MIKILWSRLAFLLGGWFLASLLIFFTLRLLPGDVAQIIGGTQASSARIAEIRTNLGLDRPLLTQYFDWISAFITGDLGTSLVSRTPVAEQLLEKAGVTLPLVLISSIVMLVIAVPLGIFTAYRAGRPLADATATTAYAAAALPAVWVALLLILIFSSWLNIFPSQGFPARGWADPLNAIYSLLLPGITIGLIEAAILFRFIRSATLSALHSEPLRTGMSFGMTRSTALIRYGLPQVGLSLIGTLGVQLAGLVVGAVVIEQIFTLPGVGTMLVSDINSRDLAKVASTLMVITGFILLLGTVMDTLAQLLDPRLRERKTR
ncbi:ABC transporter permease [Canibacter zhoujuaniae]|uniref:ABC transporter permease n=1 Tax=Canibacter zhoujuaniae TaxID=2708343 RepID=UPI0014248D27|nr:ABC transporter permease [Canibacter zhoujuaniae]